MLASPTTTAMTSSTAPAPSTPPTMMPAALSPCASMARPRSSSAETADSIGATCQPLAPTNAEARKMTAPTIEVCHTPISMPRPLAATETPAAQAPNTAVVKKRPGQMTSEPARMRTPVTRASHAVMSVSPRGMTRSVNATASLPAGRSPELGSIVAPTKPPSESAQIAAAYWNPARKSLPKPAVASCTATTATSGTPRPTAAATNASTAEYRYVIGRGIAPRR